MDFIHLDKPLVIFDVETTGLNPATDRIIELCAIRLHPDGRQYRKTWLLNPTIPIPLESIAIHGITDDLVKTQPTFPENAHEIFAFFRDCDIGGFGISHLDIPILEEEFARVNMNFNGRARRQFDALRIYHRREPRDLSAAVRFYCKKELTDAHSAENDTEATLEVLKAQFNAYPDLPRNPDELDAYLNPRDPFLLDREGRFRWLDGQITINFGRKKGKTVRDVIKEDPNYLKWILHGNFGRDTKQIAQNILNGNWPEPPSVTPSSAPVKL